MSEKSVVVSGLLVIAAIFSGCIIFDVYPNRLIIEDTDVNITETNDVAVTATLTNTNETRVNETLTCRVVLGGKVYYKSTLVTVAGNTTTDRVLVFDIPVDQTRDTVGYRDYRCRLS